MSKSPIEVVHELAQECISKSPMLVIGSGASAAHGIPGMWGLQMHLAKTPPTGATAADVKAWDKFVASLVKTDLEDALNKARLSERLTAHVVNTTWDFLVPHDVKAFDGFVADRDCFPLSRLIAHLFDSTLMELHVLTPNYDRLVEYASEAAGLSHYTGFSYGHVRTRPAAQEPRLHYGNKPARTVKIWKVHGSFDWFQDSKGNVIALPIAERRPTGAVPFIVTPGIEKYRITTEEPFLSIKQGSDLALKTSTAYLCIGYGFNDTHIQTTLVEQCRTKRLPLVLITKEVSKTARAFLSSGKCHRYLAIEEKGSGCMAYTTEYPKGVEIPGKPLWKLDEFLNMVMT